MPTPNTDKGNLKEQVNLSQIPEEPKKKKRQHHNKGDEYIQSSYLESLEKYDNEVVICIVQSI